MLPDMADFASSPTEWPPVLLLLHSTACALPLHACNIAALPVLTHRPAVLQLQSCPLILYMAMKGAGPLCKLTGMLQTVHRSYRAVRAS